jgi:hypothetical protein
MSSSPDSERREAQRVPFFADVEIRHVGTSRSWDLSTGGIHLDAPLKLPVRTVYHLRFRLSPDEDPIEVRGRVLHRLSSGGIGFSFEDLMPKDKLRIASYVAAHDADESRWSAGEE